MTPIEILIIAFAFPAVVIITGRPGGFRSIGGSLVILGCAALPWSEIEVHGVPFGDYFLIPGGCLLVLESLRSRFALFTPMVVGGIIIGVAGVLNTFLPTSSHYMAGRYIAVNPNVLYLGQAARAGGNLLNLAKYEVALIVLPAILTLGVVGSREFARRAATAWVVGITVSSAVAYSDHAGYTHISAHLLGAVAISGRQAGLTSQPNNVGVQVAMAVPLLMYAFMSGTRRTRTLVALAVVINALGLYVAGSRGGAAAIIPAVVLSLIAVPQLRQWSGRVTLLGAASIAYLAVATGGQKILTALRLSSAAASSTSQSDALRSAVRHQGFEDFLHSPLHGIGFGVADEAHLIYLQLIAAGGLIALLGFVIFAGGTLRASWSRLRDIDPFAGALIASAGTWLILGLVENQLTDQYLYVPLGLLAGMLTIDRLSRENASGRAVHDEAERCQSRCDARYGRVATLRPCDQHLNAAAGRVREAGAVRSPRLTSR